MYLMMRKVKEEGVGRRYACEVKMGKH